MAKHEWLVVYAIGDEVKHRNVAADYMEEEGSLVVFYEEPDSGTGAGGPVFALPAEALITVERLGKPKHTIQE